MNNSRFVWVNSGNLLSTLNFIFTFVIAIYVVVGNQLIPSVYLIITLTLLLYFINPIIAEKFSRKKLLVSKLSETSWEITSESPAKIPELNLILDLSNVKEISLINRYPEFHLIIEKKNGYIVDYSERMSLLRKGSLIHFAAFIKKNAITWNEINKNPIIIYDTLNLKSLISYLSNKYYIYLLILLPITSSILFFKLYNSKLNLLLLTVIVLLGIRLSIAIAYYFKTVAEQDNGKTEILDDEINW